MKTRLLWGALPLLAVLSSCGGGGSSSGPRVPTATPTVQPTSEPTVTATPDPTRNTAFYLLAGQSNMVGYGPLQDSTSQPDARVILFGNDYQFKTATEPLDSPAGQIDRVSIDPDPGVGPGLAFGLAMLPSTDGSIGLVPCAKSSRSLKAYEKASGRDTLYGSMIARAQAVLARGRVAGILFFQGEGDAVDTTRIPDAYGAQWDEHFTQLVSDIRRDLNQPDLPIVFAQLGPHPDASAGDFPRWEDVKASQASVQIANVAMIRTDDLPITDGIIHFTTPAYEEIGRRYAQAMQDLQNGTTQSRIRKLR